LVVSLMALSSMCKHYFSWRLITKLSCFPTHEEGRMYLFRMASSNRWKNNDNSSISMCEGSWSSCQTADWRKINSKQHFSSIQSGSVAQSMKLYLYAPAWLHAVHSKTVYIIHILLSCSLDPWWMGYLNTVSQGWNSV
jgi:hypothetical protein